MKVRLISDVHLEQNVGWIPPKHWEMSDLGILAGDIGSPYNPEYKNILIHAANKHKTVVLVPGNHEYYTTDGKNMDSIKEKLKEICRDTSVILLDNNTYDLDGFRIIGSTMWPKIPVEYYPFLKKQKHGLVTKIMKDLFPLTIENLISMNKQDLGFLDRMLSKVEDSIVITHYPPSYVMLNDATEHLPEVVTHWSEAMDLIKGNIKLWACGHGHTGRRFMVGGKIPLISNCVQGGEFDENFEIII